jgi:dimethylamine/trimethylamine dehydrogenase
MVDGVHKWGALAAIELCHAGGLANALDSRYVAPAMHQFPTPWMPQTYTYEADAGDLARIVRCFGEAARRGIDAGFDILTVHGTHGALPVQALSRHFNRRTDGYGGSLENRARLWLEILEAVREAADGQCAVATRFSIDQLSGPAGVEAEDEGLAFVELATRRGLLDLWDVNISSLQEWGEDAGPSRFYKTNHEAPWTVRVKQITTVPVVGVGRFTDPDEMLRALASGQLDIVGCARPSIADPWLPRKVDEGRPEDISECIGCNMCVARFEYGVPIVCTQNPTALEEYRRGWHPERFAPADLPGPVLVVGAGPAGLECARVLARRGVEVHLADADAEVGGHLRQVIRLPGLAEWGRVVTWREGQLQREETAKILRGVGQVTAEDVLGYGATRVVLATGAAWAGDGVSGLGPDPIPGVDADLAAFLTPEQLWAGKPMGERVVVLDGDGYFTAISLAQLLAGQGRRVTIVTPFDKVAPMCDFTLEGVNLRRMMRETGIAQRTAHWAARVESGPETLVHLFDCYGEGYRRTTGPRPGEPPRRPAPIAETLAADTVLLCTARRSNDGLWRALKAREEAWAPAGITGIWRAGDCLAPRYLADAIFDGHRLGRELDGSDPQRPRAIIRERRIWGGDVYPKLGDRVA